ncbi:hypothetical protein GCM10009810_13660 [Nostocoides vanveenii]|uniref:Uncharacterized protein n=1 Tax=Nostocoides vanveenii TaxID=330835 RepID=A0ABN2KFX7_9MICO
MTAPPASPGVAGATDDVPGSEDKAVPVPWSGEVFAAPGPIDDSALRLGEGDDVLATPLPPLPPHPAKARTAAAASARHTGRRMTGSVGSAGARARNPEGIRARRPSRQNGTRPTIPAWRGHGSGR